ncbi:MAG: GNAT family N-acetyltransferase [Oscillospiraceae bacterium]|nr:GNAT family N-acetyltransferase [Oscillospiraceae bacterium]
MILETQRTILRPFTEDDASDVYAYCKDQRVGPIAGWKPHESVEESREIIRTVFSAPNVFAVVDRETGRVIGSAGFVTPSKPAAAAQQGRSSEIGYALSPDYWGRGLMPEVVAELMRYGFQDLGLDEIWCTHYQENHQSKRVIEKSGFQYAFTEKLTDEFYPDRPTCFYFMTREMWEKRGN